MNRVRILFCIDNFEPDGAQRQLVDLVKHIDQSIYDISVCGIRGGTLREELEPLGIDVDIIGKKAWWELPLVAYRLFKYIKRKRPTIVQSSLFYTNLLVSVIGNLLRIPVIITVEHSVYEKDLSFWTKRLASLTLGLSDVTVTVFEPGNHYRRDGNQVLCIPNGVDLARFEIGADREILLKKYGVDSDDMIILTAGRLSPEKGHKYLVQATAILKRKYPKMKLLIAGTGELLDQLRQLVSDLDLRSSVTFLGRRKDLPLLYRLSHIFVLPSVHEGFGLVAAEAMASRTPLVATQAVSVTNLITDNETGFLVPIMDSVAIAEKVKWVLEHPEVAKGVADAAYRRVKSSFSSRLMASRYMDLYQKQLSKKGLLVSV